MPEPNTSLKNPFSKPNPLSKPLYSPAPKPTTTTVGGVSVNTLKPVFFQTPQGEQPITGDKIETKDEENKGFWASKTKKQKTIIIVSGVAVLGLIAFFAFKKK
jgi:hypothetical protein